MAGPDYPSIIDYSNIGKFPSQDGAPTLSSSHHLITLAVPPTAAMALSGSTTVVFPLKLGPASKFERSNFSLKSINSMVGDGSVLLSLTLDEMDKITELGLDLSSNPHFIRNTGIKYKDLMDKQEKLEKTPKTLNPIKYVRNYRAARVFYAAALALRNQTKETSESMQREQQEVRLGVFSSTEIHTIDDTVSSNATLDGIAIEIPGQFTVEKQQTIINATNTVAMHATDPFIDNPAVPQLSDDDSIVSLVDTASLFTQDTSVNDPDSPIEATEPMLSPSSPSIHICFVNSTFTMGSNIHAMTLNQGGSQNTS